MSLLRAVKVWGIKLIVRNNHVYTIALLYSLAIVILISIPAYFYVEVEKKSIKQIKEQELQRYSLGVEKDIYDFSSSTENIYDFPRSFLYDSYIYDKDKKLIFTTNFEQVLLAAIEDNEALIYKSIELNDNRLNASFLIVTRAFSYHDIYSKVIIFALILGMVVFFLALFFIKMSISPVEEANEYLNAFFNDAMHELRTPIGVMQLNLEILKQRGKTKEVSRLLNSLSTIMMIYEDIEYLIKYNYVDYRKEQVDFSHFLGDRIDFFSDLAQSKEITLHRELESEIYIDINRIEIQRVIDNTISNAIKYSDKQKDIYIKLKSSETNIIFSVQDNGYGIKDSKKIFTRYHRETEIKGGFGIGLSIVKQICIKNSIDIEVKSTLAKGSLFTYTFIKPTN